MELSYLIFMLVRFQHDYCEMNFSPLILLAKCISLTIIVTLLAWIAHKFVSSNSPTRYASAASCNASRAHPMKFKLDLNSCTQGQPSNLMGNSITFSISTEDNFTTLIILCIETTKFVPRFIKRMAVRKA